MRRFQYAVLFWFLVAGTLAHATDSGGSNGTLINQEACPVLKGEYEQFVQSSRSGYEQEVQSAAKIGVTLPSMEERQRTLFDRATFESRVAHNGYECVKITYLSDGFKVIGFIFKPVITEGRKLPVIIFNRGGHGDSGKVTPNNVFLWDYEFLEQGFVILAAQLRGVDGGEGKDEFGGADLDDVLSLIPLAQGLNYVDNRNVFMYGFSRGGMMTYLAMKNGAAINAAAVSGGPTDLAPWGRLRPEMGKVFEETIPDYKTDPVGTTSRRSAIDWPEKINTPVLLLHGTADWHVPTEDALRLAMKLQQLRKTYALEIYTKDLHGLPMHNDEVHRRMVEWFRQYMR